MLRTLRRNQVGYVFCAIPIPINLKLTDSAQNLRANPAPITSPAYVNAPAAPSQGVQDATIRCALSRLRSFYVAPFTHKSRHIPWFSNTRGSHNNLRMRSQEVDVERARFGVAGRVDARIRNHRAPVPSALHNAPLSLVYKQDHICLDDPGSTLCALRPRLCPYSKTALSLPRFRAQLLLPSSSFLSTSLERS